MDREIYIQKYLKNELSESEHKEFLLLLDNESGLKAEVDMLSDLYQVNKKEELNHIKSVLEEAENEHEKKENVFRRRKGLFIGLLLVAIAVSVYFINKGSSNEVAIYASYYKTPINTYYPVTRNGSTSNQELYDAFLSYEQKNFQKANDLFIGLSDYAKNTEIQFYNAISLIELGNEVAAKVILEEITTGDDYLKDEISWYRALLAIKLGDKEEAKTILNVGNIDLKPSKWKALLKSL